MYTYITYALLFFPNALEHNICVICSQTRYLRTQYAPNALYVYKK